MRMKRRLVLLAHLPFAAACSEPDVEDPIASTASGETGSTDPDEEPTGGEGSESGESTGGDAWVDPCAGLDEQTCESSLECIPAYGVELHPEQGCRIVGTSTYFGCGTPGPFASWVVCVRLEDDVRFYGEPLLHVSEELSCWDDTALHRPLCE